jgi:AcrR family transcriptional regulator
VKAQGEPKTAAVGRREQQRRETLRVIKAAALELFAQNGFDATTTKQIADAAGVAHGTVFLVAPTKDALLVAVLEEQLRQVLEARTASMPRRSVEAQIRHLCDGLYAFHAQRPDLSRVFVRAVLFFSDPVAKAQYEEHVSGFSRYLATLLEKAKARGELAARTKTDAAADNTVALYVHLLVSFLNESTPDRRALESRFKSGLDLLFRGLAPTAPRGGNGSGRLLGRRA